MFHFDQQVVQFYWEGGVTRLASSVRQALIGMLALFGFGAPMAQADIKIFSAGECTVTSNVPGVIELTSIGVMRNTSFVTDGSIACFLVRDHPGQRPTRIEVSVVDNSSVLVGVKDISCRAILVGRFGTSSSSGAFVSTSATNAAGTILNVPVPGAATPNGPLVVQCTIPRRAAGNAPSTVASIRVVEPNPTP